MDTEKPTATFGELGIALALIDLIKLLDQKGVISKSDYGIRLTDTINAIDYKCQSKSTKLSMNSNAVSGVRELLSFIVDSCTGEFAKNDKPNQPSLSIVTDDRDKEPDK